MFCKKAKTNNSMNINDYNLLKKKYLIFLNTRSIELNKLIIKMNEHKINKDKRRREYNPKIV